MELLSRSLHKVMHIGRLAVLDDTDDECTVFVVCGVDERQNSVFLVELDRPHDGQQLSLNLHFDDVYLLGPHEVIERVNEWK